MTNKTPVLEVKDLGIDFGGLTAVNNFNMEIYPHEIVGLIGPNGAGKTTVFNMLTKVYEPTRGKIILCGKDMDKMDTVAANKAGIARTFQNIRLFTNLSVIDNVKIGMHNSIKYSTLDSILRLPKYYKEEARIHKEAMELLKIFNMDKEADVLAGNLPYGAQRRLEIARALATDPKLLLLDEPAAGMNPQETEELFAVIRRIVKEKQMTVIIITHKLYEVMNISDRVGVMRRGELVGVEETKNVDERILASMMVGREVLFDHIEKTGEPGEVKIKADNLYVTDNRGLLAVSGVSLEVKAGEVLGIAAIEGNGQSELIEALTGIRPVQRGSFYICGAKADGMNPGQIRKLGAAHIPEDRVATGVSLKSTITENLIVGKEKLPAFSKYKLHLKQSSIARYAREVAEKFDIRGGGVDIKTEDLSGGNMQKVVVAREFSFDTPVLIVAQPTRGVDIGAIEFIHKQIIDKRNQGCAILLVSADLDEIFRLSDRIITMFEGRVTGEFKSGEIDKMEISYYMTGHRDGEGGENDK